MNMKKRREHKERKKAEENQEQKPTNTVRRNHKVQKAAEEHKKAYGKDPNRIYWSNSGHYQLVKNILPGSILSNLGVAAKRTILFFALSVVILFSLALYFNIDITGIYLKLREILSGRFRINSQNNGDRLVLLFLAFNCLQASINLRNAAKRKVGETASIKKRPVEVKQPPKDNVVEEFNLN